MSEIQFLLIVLTLTGTGPYINHVRVVATQEECDLLAHTEPWPPLGKSESRTIYCIRMVDGRKSDPPSRQ